jgi:subtilisin family serine protease
MAKAKRHRRSKRPTRKGGAAGAASDSSTPPAGVARVSSTVEELLLKALESGGEALETGRFLVTIKEGASAQEGLAALGVDPARVADTRDFDSQVADFESLGDAQAANFGELPVVLVGGDFDPERLATIAEEIADDSPIETIEPEHVVFGEMAYSAYYGSVASEAYPPLGESGQDYLRVVAKVLEVIARETYGGRPQMEVQEQIAAAGATWGVVACRVPQSTRSGVGIRVAVLDTGMDLGHPDFSGRHPTSKTFVEQAVQDMHGHGTHCIGTSCGPKTASASAQGRYGVAHRASIFVGKVLLNSGGSVDGSVLSGMNWAIANRCQVISMSLEGPGGPHSFYTKAGQTALNNGLLMIAAAGNRAQPTGAPANSPTIVSVASLDPGTLSPSSFSNFGKVDIAGPGRDVYSSYTRVKSRYKILSGTSMATPHVAGCAALWAESSTGLRGQALLNKLRATVKSLPFPPSRVGAGLVQAP